MHSLCENFHKTNSSCVLINVDRMDSSGKSTSSLLTVVVFFFGVFPQPRSFAIDIHPTASPLMCRRWSTHSDNGLFICSKLFEKSVSCCVLILSLSLSLARLFTMIKVYLTYSWMKDSTREAGREERSVEGVSLASISLLFFFVCRHIVRTCAQKRQTNPHEWQSERESGVESTRWQMTNQFDVVRRSSMSFFMVWFWCIGSYKSTCWLLASRWSKLVILHLNVTRNDMKVKIRARRIVRSAADADATRWDLIEKYVRRNRLHSLLTTRCVFILCSVGVTRNDDKDDALEAAAACACDAEHCCIDWGSDGKAGHVSVASAGILL